nr:hypothetical protein [Alteromonas macleodii]
MSNWFKATLLPKAKQNLIYTMILGGLALMALGTFLPATAGTVWDKLLSLFLSFGSALIGGGVFAALLKSAQFTELFQKHIFEVRLLFRAKLGLFGGSIFYNYVCIS